MKRVKWGTSFPSNPKMWLNWMVLPSTIFLLLPRVRMEKWWDSHNLWTPLRMNVSLIFKILKINIVILIGKVDELFACVQQFHHILFKLKSVACIWILDSRGHIGYEWYFCFVHYLEGWLFITYNYKNSLVLLKLWDWIEKWDIVLPNPFFFLAYFKFKLVPTNSVAKVKLLELKHNSTTRN